ncbi:hypothetical protein AAFN88_20825 [Pelagibius sp. CAU 1746]|uniref:hypothetical protein n=1 Tax=Pelagibius sp. CAU 1746 TaxID=3140370 RepID=UPI00325C205E
MTLRVFATLGRTVVFGLRHFPAFLLLCLLANLPTSLYGLLRPEDFQAAMLEGESWETDLVTGLEVMLLGLVTAIMVHTRLRDQQGESWTVLPAIGDTVEYLPAVLGVSFCISVGVTLISVLVAVLAEIAPILAFAPLLIMAVLTLIFAVVMPCAALHDGGVVDCFGQSASLAQGSRLRIVAIYVLFLIPVGIAGAVLIGVYAPGMERAELPASAYLYLLPFGNVFFFALPVIMHEQLAGLDDGVELSETAAVFD